MKETDKAPSDFDFDSIQKRQRELQEKMRPAIKQVHETVKRTVEAKK